MIRLARVVVCCLAALSATATDATSSSSAVTIPWGSLQATDLDALLNAIDSFVAASAAVDGELLSRARELSSLARQLHRSLSQANSPIFYTEGLWRLIATWRGELQLGAPGTTAAAAPSAFRAGISRQYVEYDAEALRSLYAGNDGVLYLPSFFDEATVSELRRMASAVWRQPERSMEVNCHLDGHNRSGGYLLARSSASSSSSSPADTPDESAYSLIYGNEPFRRFLDKLFPETFVFPSDFPIELREYGRKSGGMRCHSDIVMYSSVDLEFVVTLRNNSECETSFKKADGSWESVRTQGNSLLLVGAGRAVHCVSSTGGGSREVLKFIFTNDFNKVGAFRHYASNTCDVAHGANARIVRRKKAQLSASGGAASVEL